MGHRPTPPPEEKYFWGGLTPLFGFSLLPAAAWIVTGQWWWSIFLAPVCIIVLLFVYARALLIAAWIRWRRTPVMGILITSDSPHWRNYIERKWLTRFAEHSVVLNWSQRKSWKSTLPVLLYEHHVQGGDDHNHVPAFLMFRGLRNPYCFRYFYAFRDAKHGRTEALRKLEQRMFDEIERRTAKA